MLIDMELEDLEGIRSTKTSYQKGQAEVEFDENKTEDEKIIEAIKEAGYKVSAVI
jgi:copper chaperone CopZ